MVPPRPPPNLEVMEKRLDAADPRFVAIEAQIAWVITEMRRMSDTIDRQNELLMMMQIEERDRHKELTGKMTQLLNRLQPTVVLE